MLGFAGCLSERILKRECVPSSLKLLGAVRVNGPSDADLLLVDGDTSVGLFSTLIIFPVFEPVGSFHLRLL